MGKKLWKPHRLWDRQILHPSPLPLAQFIHPKNIILKAIVFDTDILIDHLGGVALARDYLKQQRDSQEKLLISTVTEAELFAGKKMDKESEAKRTERLLELFDIIRVDSQIAREAGKLRRSFGCALPDAIIAATAVLRESKLVTRNKGHFEMIPNLDVVVPY